MSEESDITAREPQAPAQPAAAVTNVQPPMQSPAPGRRWLRRVLLLLGPLLVLCAGAYVYLSGGRYVETDNAYVKADKVMLSPQVPGPITAVQVEENQHVVAGQELFRIDPAPFHVARDRAQARLRGVRTFLQSLQAGYRQKQEELKRDQTDMEYNQREYQRQQELARNDLASKSRLDAARHELEMAQRQIDITRRALEQLAVQLGGSADSPLEQHPLYQEAAAAITDADLNLDRTVVRSPITGVAQKKPEPGQYVRAGEPVMAIVADAGMWVEANFKETELTHVQPGQQVRIRVDTYPDRDWSGTVTSLSQASGAEFSLLPPQNATGNWVKVVQRIPVRIAIDGDPDAPPLRSGMSTTVRIDTRYQRSVPGILRVPLSWVDGIVGSAAASRG